MAGLRGRLVCSLGGCLGSHEALGASSPHLRQDWAHPARICTGTGLTPPTSVPGLSSPLPHLRRDWAHPAHICTRTGLTRATSAPGLGSPHPRLRRDWAGIRLGKPRHGHALRAVSGTRKPKLAFSALPPPHLTAQASAVFCRSCCARIRPAVRKMCACAHLLGYPRDQRYEL